MRRPAALRSTRAMIWRGTVTSQALSITGTVRRPPPASSTVTVELPSGTSPEIVSAHLRTIPDRPISPVTRSCWRL